MNTDITDYYIPSPPATDPAILLREERIRTRHLRRELARAEAEVADRERFIGELLQELASLQ